MFQFSPCVGIAKTGPNRTFPVSGIRIIVIAASFPCTPPLTNVQDPYHIFSLIFLSDLEARQRHTASWEKTPAHWSSTLDPSQFLDSPQL